MDLGTTITGIIIILICVLPIVILNRLSRKREQELLQSLIGLAHMDNCKISHHDIWKEAAIGIDDSANIIFFTNKLNEIEIAQKIPLDEIIKTKVIITKGNNSDLDRIEKLDLEFTSKDKNKAEMTIEFYKASFGSNLNNELKLVNKWCNLLNDKIKTLTKRI